MHTLDSENNDTQHAASQFFCLDTAQFQNTLHPISGCSNNPCFQCCQICNALVRLRLKRGQDKIPRGESHLLQLPGGGGSLLMGLHQFGGVLCSHLFASTAQLRLL